MKYTGKSHVRENDALWRKLRHVKSFPVCFFCLFLLLFSLTASADSFQDLSVGMNGFRIHITGMMPDHAAANLNSLDQNIYDLSVRREDGTCFQPAGRPLMVAIQSDTKYAVYHLGENGWEQIESEWNGNETLFYAEHFSLYAITQSTDLIISPDEIRDSVLKQKTIPVCYQTGNTIYSPQELMNSFHVQLPSELPSGRLTASSERIMQSLRDAGLVSEPTAECSFHVYGKGLPLHEINQAFHTVNGIFYSVLDIQDEIITASSEDAEAKRMKIALDISENNRLIQPDESVVVSLPPLNAKHLVRTMGEDEGVQDLTFHIVDAQTGAPVSGHLMLLNADEEIIWSSELGTSHILSSAENILSCGNVYFLQETSVQSDYCLPGFPWMLTIDENGIIQVTESLQQGVGCAESLGLQYTEGTIEVQNEKKPYLTLHYQDENSSTERLELLAGNLDTQFNADACREGYSFLGWSLTPASLETVSDIHLQVTAGFENHLYGVWQEILNVNILEYAYGDYEHAVIIEGTDQTPSASLPIGISLLNAETGNQYLDTSMLPVGMRIAFACIDGNVNEKIESIVKTEYPELGLIRWEASTGNGFVPVGAGRTLNLYAYKTAVSIPVHVFEISTDGVYDQKDEWKINEYHSIDLDFGVSCILRQPADILTGEFSSLMKCKEIVYGHMDADGEFILDMIHSGQSLTYTWEGICLNNTPTGLGPDTWIAYIYYPAFRNIPIHIMEYLITGQAVERPQWQKTATISISTDKMIFQGTNALASLLETVLTDDVIQSVAFDSAYYGISYSERSETGIQALQNTSKGIHVNDGEEYLSDADELFLVFYENPRIWPVHVVERTVNGFENRDADWNVQPIRVTEEKTEIKDFDPRFEADEQYVLSVVKRCDTQSNLGNSTKSKDISSVMNTVNGLQIRLLGQGGYTLLKSPQQIFFLYYLKAREMPVRYANVQNGTLIPIQESMLDLSDDGNAVSSFLCGDENFEKPFIGSPHWAVLGDDGNPIYHPFVVYAVAPEGMASTGTIPVLTELPWFQNSFASIKQKNSETGRASNIGLDKSLYVLYDFAQDPSPAYLKISNFTENEMFTFRLTVNSGAYTAPILKQAEWSGTYLRAVDGKYNVPLGPGEDQTMYIPSGGGAAYAIEILDREGNPVQECLEEHDLELSVQPLSSPLIGELKTGMTYFWTNRKMNAYTAMEEESNLTQIAVQDQSIMIPAPTGQERNIKPWLILFSIVIMIAVLADRAAKA